MDSIANIVRDENDILYIIGQRTGEERIITRLLQKKTYSIDQIADMAGVSVDFVKKIKQKLTGID